jgi:hypothetical protein
MLTEEILVAGMTDMVGTGDPTILRYLGAVGELLAFPASRRTSFGAAGPLDVTDLCTTDLTGFFRTMHARRMLAAGKATGDRSGAIYFVKSCGQIADCSVRRVTADKTSQPTTGHYLCRVHTVIPLGQWAIDNRHKVASIRGYTDDLEDRLSDNVHGSATTHDHPHGTVGIGLVSAYDGRS